MSAAGMVPLRLAATLAHALPGVRLRLRDRDHTIHGFATTLTPRHCRRLNTEPSAAVRSPAEVGGVRQHRDAAPEVTLVHALTPVGLAVERHGALEDLLVKAVAEEVVGDFARATRS